MSSDFAKIDSQLRAQGRVFKVLAHPSRQGLRFLHWIMSLSKDKDLEGVPSRTVWIDRSREGAAGRNEENVGPLRVRVFGPKNATKPVPVLLFFHGGGYAIGLPEQDSALKMFTSFIETRDCVIVAPDYRLSFDAPYPAALNDCYDSLLWAKEHAAEIGGRADQIFVAGDSAGGGLTAATTLLARDRGDVNIAFQMPLYPMIDDSQSNPSAVDNSMPVWNSRHNKVAWKLYLRGVAQNGNEIPAYAAPARADSYANLPPTATFVGDLDPFLDETRIYVENLESAGVSVQFRVFEGCYHGFDQLVPNADKTKAAIRFINDAYGYAVDNYFVDQP